MTRPSYLEYNIKLMKTICLWPLNTESVVVSILNFVYGITMAASLGLVSVGQTIAIFSAPDLSTMASAVDLLTLTASALFKMSYIIIYNKHFRDLVAKIDDNFVETDFYDNTFQMKKWLRNSKLFSTVYSFSSTVCLLGFFVVVPILARSYVPFLSSRPFGNSQSGNLVESEGRLDPFNNVSSFMMNSGRSPRVDEAVEEEQFFPLKCWFPFDVTWSPLYEIVILLEIYPLLGSGHLYLVSDSFFFMIIYLSCGQLEILKRSLRGLRGKHEDLVGEIERSLKDKPKDANGRLSPIVWDLYSREKEIERKINTEIKRCVEFHVKIMEVVCELDVLLRSMILVDFIHAVISLSFALLQTATANALYEWMQMFLFLAICILHQFLNNYFAEMLTQQQASVAEAVYETDWVRGPRLLSCAVLLTTPQARHTTRLSGWKMYLLGLPTFVEFMKSLVSYFLVLQTLQAKEEKVTGHL